ERHDAGTVEPLGHHRWNQSVHGPGKRRTSRRPELARRHKNNVGNFGQGGDGSAVEQVAGEGLDVGLLQGLREARLRETRNADDPSRNTGLVARAAREAGKRRSHLAADAEDHQVAGKASHRLDIGLRRTGESFFQRLLGFEAHANLSSGWPAARGLRAASAWLQNNFDGSPRWPPPRSRNAGTRRPAFLAGGRKGIRKRTRRPPRWSRPPQPCKAAGTPARRRPTR